MITTAVSSTRSSSIGFRPKQNIPEAQKDDIWHYENADWCISMSPIFFHRKTDDYYDLHNGKRSPDDWDHITKTYGIEFPAGKMKHIPLVRPMISRIHSESEERNYEWTARAEDDSSVEDKIKDVSGKILKEVMQLINSDEDLDRGMEKMRQYYQEEYKTELEIGIHHYLRQYIQKHRFERIASDCFLDKCISGQQFYQVRVNRVGEDPEFIPITPGSLFWAENSKKWINECDWAVRVVRMTPTEILDAFGERMKEKDVKQIENWLDMYHKDAFYRLSSAAEADQMLDRQFDQAMMSNVNHRIAVYYVEWKSIRRIAYIENENKYVPDAPFIKYISESELYELPRSRKEKVKYRYIQDLHSCVRIGDSIYVDAGRVKHPIRSMAVPSKVYLSFNGLTHNGKIKPYSLYEHTKDLQDLYDVLHYHKENLIALSGVAGSYMDISQMPDFGTGKFDDNIKMFMYYKKMGTAFIDTMKEGASKHFNTFPSYNETLGAGLKVILEMITHIEEVAGRMLGTPRQALGQQFYYDGKSTTQSAIQNSSLVIEWLYNQHDEFVERALTDIVNASRVAYPDGVSGHYTDNKGMQQIYRLDPNFALSDYGIHILNKTSDKYSIQELKQLSAEMIKAGMMQIEDITPLFRKTSLTDIIKTIEINASRRRMMLEEQNAKLQQLQTQLGTEKEQAAIGKLKAEIAKISSDIEDNKKKLSIEERELIGSEEVKKLEAKLKEKQVDLEREQLELQARQQKPIKSGEPRNIK